MDGRVGLNQRFVARIEQLQYGDTQKYLVFLPVACGLGGQISGRTHTLVMALALGRKAVFLGVEDRPYGQTFEAMHGPVNLPGTRDTWPLADSESEQDDAVVCYDPSRKLISDSDFERAIRQFGTPSLDQLMLEGLIFNWMRPTPTMRAFCRAQGERLGVGLHCLGVHFRRGDKAVETAFVPASEFNRQIARIHKIWPFTSVFLASDSPLAPQEIQCPRGVTLIFDTEEQRYNNANHKMLLKSPELVEQETQVAFKNIALLASCGGVVGQDNAHFATLAAASIMARDERTDRSILIAGRFAEENSRLLASYFRMKKAIRMVARRLLPHLTMSGRIKRNDR